MDASLELYKTKNWRELQPKDFEFLSEKGICNGCGGGGDMWWQRLIRRFIRWILSKLRAIFVEASCHIHDFTYWQGGDEKRRKECDYGFFLAIVGDIQNYVQDTWKFLGYTLLALALYIAVRLLGRFYFRYR